MATKSLLVTEQEEWGGVKCGSGDTAFSQPMKRERDRVSVKALGIKFTGQGGPVLGRLVRFQIQGRVVVAISHLSSQSVCSSLLKRWGCPRSAWGGPRSHCPLPALCTPTSCFENCCNLIQGSLRCVPQTSTFMPRVPRAPAPVYRCRWPQGHHCWVSWLPEGNGRASCRGWAGWLKLRGIPASPKGGLQNFAHQDFASPK